MSVILTCEVEHLSINNGVPVCSEWQIYQYTDASNLVEAMDRYFAFDLETFLMLSGFLIVSWLISFSAGAVARTLGRT